MTRSGWIKVGIAAVAVGALTLGALVTARSPKAVPPAPTSAPSSTNTAPLASPATTVSGPSTTLRPSMSMEAAADLVEGYLGVPVVLPSPLPPGARLDSRKPFYLSPGGVGSSSASGTLNFKLAPRGRLLIQYGSAGFDGCGGADNATVVSVGGLPGLLKEAEVGDGQTWTQLIWPATTAHPSGRFGLYGSLSGDEMLALAQSMSTGGKVESSRGAVGC